MDTRQVIDEMNRNSFDWWIIESDRYIAVYNALRNKEADEAKGLIRSYLEGSLLRGKSLEAIGLPQNLANRIHRQITKIRSTLQ